MTPDQRQLARHALGLPNEKRRSYRNRFDVPPAHPSHVDWYAMTRAGEAERIPPRQGAPQPTCDRFRLTRRGAGLALEPGESLDAEDFG